MPRRNEKAREREIKQWSTDYIKMLMKKMRIGNVENEYKEELPIKNKTKKGK